MQCSHCHKEGHNLRTCPKRLAAELKKVKRRLTDLEQMLLDVMARLKKLEAKNGIRAIMVSVVVVFLGLLFKFLRIFL